MKLGTPSPKELRERQEAAARVRYFAALALAALLRGTARRAARKRDKRKATAA